MPNKKSSKPDSNRPSFEESLEELEKVVQQLELGKLGLSESIETYERGVKLLKQCHQELERVERKIQLLTRVDPDGQAIVETLSEEPGVEDVDRGQRARKRGYSPSDEENEIDDGSRLF